MEEFLKEGITNWERLNATCASFSEWVSTSETVVDREFFGTTVKEAETLYNAILVSSVTIETITNAVVHT